MRAQGCVCVVLTTLVGPVLTFLLDSGSSSSWNHCSRYAEYNTLINLKSRDSCTNVDSVFTLLADLTTKSGNGACRIEVIKKLSDYFGPHARTPDNCQCQGANVLQHYHTGSGDHVPELRRNCLVQDPDYQNLYDQFFENHNQQTVPACRTHHSIWYSLGKLDTQSIDDSSCQKDFVFHLSYAFKHHADKCTCSSITGTQHVTNGQQGSIGESCLQYHSYNVLQRLGETDGCLSANSVWHYLDDLQVKDPVCRETIQRQLADKYRNAYFHVTDNCVCRSRVPLVDHAIHRMDIEAALFSNIVAHGCQNHNQLQYPDSLSDNCVCSEVTTTASSSTTTTTTTTTTSTTTSTTTTTQPTPTPNKFTCNKFVVVEDIAMSVHTSHPNSSPCDQHAGGYDDALVLSTCNTTSPNTWRQGPSVVTDCRFGTHSIPPFTPISTFNHGYYSPGVAKSGVFLECQNNFIKMVIQNCNRAPEIIQIDTGKIVNSDMMFYVIV